MDDFPTVKNLPQYLLLLCVLCIFVLVLVAPTEEFLLDAQVMPSDKSHRGRSILLASTVLTAQHVSVHKRA